MLPQPNPLKGQLRWITFDPDPTNPWATVREQAWWEEPHGQWTIALRLTPDDGFVIASELRIFPTAGQPQKPGEWNQAMGGLPPGGISNKVLRNFSVTQALARARQALIDEATATPLEKLEEVARRRDPELLETPLISAGFTNWKKLDNAHPSQRPGSPGWGIEWHLRIAAVYEMADIEGSQEPTKDVAYDLDLDANHVSKALHRCRHKYNLLTRVPPGRRSGGRLTAHARALIEEFGWNDGETQ